MTQSAFDPACLSTYPASNPPKFLHFEFEGSSDIHRYMLVDRFGVNDISPATKRTANDGSATDEQIQSRYINPAGQGAKAPATEIAEIAELQEQGELVAHEPKAPELPTADEETQEAPTGEGAPNEPVTEPTEPEPNAEATTEQPEAPTDS